MKDLESSAVRTTTCFPSNGKRQEACRLNADDTVKLPMRPHIVHRNSPMLLRFIPWDTWTCIACNLKLPAPAMVRFGCMPFTAWQPLQQMPRCHPLTTETANYVCQSCCQTAHQNWLCPSLISALICLLAPVRVSSYLSYIRMLHSNTLPSPSPPHPQSRSVPEEDVEVRLEDQKAINTFGRLNTRLNELEEEIKEKRSLYDQLDDAANEIILADDDEPIRRSHNCLLPDTALRNP
eukprot:1378391-Pleurochrysis_carterae.AAC.2